MIEAFSEAKAGGDIQAVGRVIQQHIREQWDSVFQTKRDEMVEKYPEIGDSVYAIYGTALFKPVHKAMKAAGLKATPSLPGKLGISREWGDDESDRQRWMWSKITRAEDGSALGTIVIVYHHDHVEVRIPRPMEVIALEESGKAAVIEALSRRSPEFAVAKDINAEYADYLASLAEEEQST